MKRLAIFNVVLMPLFLVFYQMNTSFFSYIHFISWQSFFTRSDYVVISVILMVILIVLSFVSWKVFKIGKNSTYNKVMYYEFSILLILGIVLVLGFIYAVFNPPVPLMSSLEYNRPNLGFVAAYFFEVIILALLLFKLMKYRLSDE